MSVEILNELRKQTAVLLEIRDRLPKPLVDNLVPTLPPTDLVQLVTCPKCKSANVRRVGTEHTPGGIYAKYSCIDCRADIERKPVA